MSWRKEWRKNEPDPQEHQQTWSLFYIDLSTINHPGIRESNANAFKTSGQNWIQTIF